MQDKRINSPRFATIYVCLLQLYQITHALWSLDLCGIFKSLKLAFTFYINFNCELLNGNVRHKF